MYTSQKEYRKTVTDVVISDLRVEESPVEEAVVLIHTSLLVVRTGNSNMAKTHSV